MKTLKKISVAVIIVAIAFTSCKKKSTKPVGPLGANYPYVLNTIITPAIIDSLEIHGMIINPGLTPPSVNGIYLLSPDVCLYDNTKHFYVGQIIDDYKYQFNNQNNSAFTIGIKYKDVSFPGTNTGSDSTATYISGTGNSFTVFAQIQGVLNGVSYTSLEIYSGIIAGNGITNFQNALYIQSKIGDANNTTVAPVGTIRVFKDGDGLSVTQSTFAIIQQQVLTGGGNRRQLSLFSIQ